jgi:hypothetical protein
MKAAKTQAKPALDATLRGGALLAAGETVARAWLAAAVGTALREPAHPS